jgi:hypothetical protein
MIANAMLSAAARCCMHISGLDDCAHRSAFVAHADSTSESEKQMKIILETDTTEYAMSVAFPAVDWSGYGAVPATGGAVSVCSAHGAPLQ